MYVNIYFCEQAFIGGNPNMAVWKSTVPNVLNTSKESTLLASKGMRIVTVDLTAISRTALCWRLW
jgi:hypothetical protein